MTAPEATAQETPRYLVAFALLLLLAAFGTGVASHLAFTENFRDHLWTIVLGDCTDRQKLAALLGAGKWVPTWRVALCVSTFFTLLLALMSCYGFEPRGPANWIFMFILLFSASDYAQAYRAVHAEGDAAYRALRILEPETPHTSFWEELLRPKHAGA